MKSTVRLLLSFLMIISIGCAPLRKQDINSSLFKDPKIFVAKVVGLHRGMNEEQFLEQLGLDHDLTKVPNLEILGPDDIWKYVYGRTEVRASPEEIERYKAKLIAPYKAYRFPYSYIEKWFSTIVVTANAKIQTSGYDLAAIAVFENDILWRAPLEGRGKIDTTETVYIWDMLGDLSGGAAMQGGKEAVKNAF